SIGLICQANAPKSQLDLRHFPACPPCYFKDCHSFGTAYGTTVNHFCLLTVPAAAPAARCVRKLHEKFIPI
ncbi:MAG: hypothetical protein WAW39_01300, partial [Prosthecobacter sp.]|uniref:hypothetical protein n=1 Tax=Prosthecobacter sp. TaxID=1965333 RepID=UPI003BB128A3